MTWLIYVAMALLFLAIIAGRLKHRKSSLSGYPYQKRPALFSTAERSFLGILDQAVSDQYRIFGKVRIADVVEPKRGLDAGRRQRAFNRINSKHFDFLLCAKGDLSVVCAIELDDQSHRERKRRERDAFVEGVCQAVSLPLARISAQHMYTVPEVRAAILAVLDKPTASAPERSLEPPASAPELLGTTSDGSPECPKCGSPMLRRLAKSGRHAGEKFWGCSAYPKCRQVIKEESYEPTEPRVRRFLDSNGGDHR
jgi:ribosomal protein L37AE/L43A